MVRSQGPRALYKGALTNALGQIPNNAIVFGSYGSTLAWLARTFPSPPDDKSISGGWGGYWHVFLAGCWAGFLQCLALGPFEHVKLQQQTTDWKPGVPRVGMRECARGLVASKGVAGGLYRGFWSLVWRCVDVVGEIFVFWGFRSIGCDWFESILCCMRHQCIFIPIIPSTPIYRDAPTYGLYFVVYEGLKDLLAPPGTGDTVSPLFALFWGATC